jgi:hypothetical protein
MDCFFRERRDLYSFASVQSVKYLRYHSVFKTTTRKELAEEDGGPIITTLMDARQSLYQRVNVRYVAGTS